MTGVEALVWSGALSTSTLLVFVLGGRTSPRLRASGWVLALLSEPAWAFYGYRTGGFFFVAQAVVFGAVAVWNLRTLARSQRTPAVSTGLPAQAAS